MNPVKNPWNGDYKGWLESSDVIKQEKRVSLEVTTLKTPEERETEDSLLKDMSIW